MATKILILILGITNLHAEKHNKGEHYDSILESIGNSRQQTPELLYGVLLNGNVMGFLKSHTKLY